MNKPVQDVFVKKPKQDANYNKYIKSNLYSPSDKYSLMFKEAMTELDPKPLFSSILPSIVELPSLQAC